jgi:hypothetical protein
MGLKYRGGADEGRLPTHGRMVLEARVAWSSDLVQHGARRQRGSAALLTSTRRQRGSASKRSRTDQATLLSRYRVIGPTRDDDEAELGPVGRRCTTSWHACFASPCARPVLPCSSRCLPPPCALPALPCSSKCALV